MHSVIVQKIFGEKLKIFLCVDITEAQFWFYSFPLCEAVWVGSVKKAERSKRQYKRKQIKWNKKKTSEEETASPCS